MITFYKHLAGPRRPCADRVRAASRL